MSYLNGEQAGESARLERIPPEKRCYCGWYDLGDCPNCPPGRTCADKLALRCKHPECRNYPPANKPDEPIIHTMNCPTRKL